MSACLSEGLSFDFLHNCSSDRLHSWQVHCWGPKEVQVWVQALEIYGTYLWVVHYYCQKYTLCYVLGGGPINCYCAEEHAGYSSLLNAVRFKTDGEGETGETKDVTDSYACVSCRPYFRHLTQTLTLRGGNWKRNIANSFPSYQTHSCGILFYPGQCKIWGLSADIEWGFDFIYWGHKMFVWAFAPK